VSPGLEVDVQWLGEVSAYIVALAATTAAVAALAKARPVRWIGRQLVGKPVTDWHVRIVAEVVREVVADEIEPIKRRQTEIDERTKQLVPNGGSSLADTIRTIDTRTRKLAERTERLTTRLTGVEDRMDEFELTDPTDPEDPPQEER